MKPAAVKIYGFVSSAGMVLCGIYLVIMAVCVLLSMASGTDSKGKFVFLQLPIALQLALAEKLGFGGLLRNVGWVQGYFIFGLPTLPILYMIGRILSQRERK